MLIAEQLVFSAMKASLTESRNSSFSDPAFTGNKSLPIHRWVPWVAGFSSKFVDDVLDRYLDTAGLVLDPFAGVGTTLVEALLRGHEAIGFEINPYALLSCRIKTTSPEIVTERLWAEIEHFQEFYQEKTVSGYEPACSPPKGFRTQSAFYSPKVLRKVLIVQEFISGIERPKIRDLFRLSFAATMVRYSNYSYEPSLGRRRSAGKEEIEDFEVGELIVAKLEAMLVDIKWIQGKMPGKIPQARIIHDSFFNYHQHLFPATVDLVLTSPPYLNNYHYNRNTRPQLYWLGYTQSPKDFKPLENANFGKYWQTVRNSERLDLDFTLPDSELADRLELLRQINPHKKPYGGLGWANYAVSYFNDCYKFAQGIKHVLKKDSSALVVIGNSILQGIMIPTDVYFGQVAQLVGLELVDIHIPRNTRVGNSIIQSKVRGIKAKDSHHLYEAVVELRRV